MTSEPVATASPALQLYDYQRRWVQDESRFKIAMFARQCGKTFTSTLEIVLDCLRAESQGQRRRWVILSRGERQAREFLQQMAGPLRSLRGDQGQKGVAPLGGFLPVGIQGSGGR